MSKKNPTTEDDVKALVEAWFEGGWSYAPVHMGMGEHGIPDRIGFVPVVIGPEHVGKTFGVFVAVECKKPGRRGEKNRGCSPNQARNIREILAAGGIAFVCDGEDDLRTAETDWSWIA